MDWKLSARQLFVLSWHVDQTEIVAVLLMTGFVSELDFKNVAFHWEDDKIVQEWHLFTELRSADYAKLARAGYPVLNCRFGTWVGFFDQDPGYEDVIHRKLAKALFGADVTGDEIRAMRAGTVGNRATTSDRIRRILD